MPSRRTIVSAFASMAIAAASLTVLAEPAAACSCAQRDLERSLAAGDTVAIVTRIDDGSTTQALFRVEDSLGPPAPPVLTGQVNDGVSCQPWVDPQGVAALVFGRIPVPYHLGACAEVDLGTALGRAQGKPATADGGPPVTLVTGSFGGSRLLGIDQDGTVVARDGLAGRSDSVAICPGGDVVLSLGGVQRPRGPYGSLELTVHDARTLVARRTVALTKPDTQLLGSLRCADRRGRTAQAFLWDQNTFDIHVVSIDTAAGKWRRTGAPLHNLSDVTPDRTGFLALEKVSKQPPAVVRISPAGKRSVLATLTGFGYTQGLTLSPDGSLLAVAAFDRRNRGSVLSYDVRTGRLLGSTTQPNLSSTVGWTDSNRLVVRTWVHTDRRPDTTVPLIFDRKMRPLGEWAPIDNRGGFFAVLGEDVILFHHRRMSATSQDGSTRVYDNLRLAAGEQVVPLRSVDG